MNVLLNVEQVKKIILFLNFLDEFYDENKTISDGLAKC